MVVGAGDRFGRLVVITRLPKSKIVCKCDCGNTKTIIAGNLASGNTKSCGCMKSDHARNVSKTHGHACEDKKSGAYRAWLCMRQRCKRDKDYVGVEVCDRWSDFIEFYKDMGDRPDGMSLDRIDGSKGYAPDNCRWATKSEQAINRKTTVFLEHNGRKMCISDWAKETGIKKRTISARIQSGWTVEKALSKTEAERKELFK